MSKYFFYIKNGLIKFYDKKGKNKVDDTYQIKCLNLSKTEIKNLDIFGHKKIIDGKLVVEEPKDVKKKKELKEKITKVKGIEELKQILLEDL